MFLTVSYKLLKGMVEIPLIRSRKNSCQIQTREQVRVTFG